MTHFSLSSLLSVIRNLIKALGARFLSMIDAEICLNSSRSE